MPGITHEILKDKPCVIFDYDDTIVESKPHRPPLLTRTLADFGYSVTQADFQKAYGQPFAVFIESLAPGVNFDDFLSAYTVQVEENPAPLLPGVKTLLDELKFRDRRTAIVTSSSSSLVIAELGAHGLSRYFELIAGTDSQGAVKPHPDALLEAMGSLSASPEKSVYVGDSPGDMEFAHAAGIDFLGVCAGGLTTKQKFIDAGLNPDRVLNNLSEALQ